MILVVATMISCADGTRYQGLDTQELWSLGYATVQSWADVAVVALAGFWKDSFNQEVLARNLGI